MSNGYQSKVFQLAFELAIRATLPQGTTMANVVEKLSAASAKPRGGYDREEWARDFLGCLPEDQDAIRLIVLAYVPGYVCQCGLMHMDAGRCDACGEYPELYRWHPAETRRVGGLARAFWQRVQARRLFTRGLRIVERGA